MHCAKHLDALLYALRLPASSGKWGVSYPDTYSLSDADFNCNVHANCNTDVYADSDTDSYFYFYTYCYSNGNRYTFTKPVRGSQLHRH